MIGSTKSIPWRTNPFLSQENEKFLIFSKMILQVIVKLLPIILTTFGSLNDAVFDSENFLDLIHQNVSIMPSNFSAEPQIRNKVM